MAVAVRVGKIFAAVAVKAGLAAVEVRVADGFGVGLGAARVAVGFAAFFGVELGAAVGLPTGAWVLVAGGTRVGAAVDEGLAVEVGTGLLVAPSLGRDVRDGSGDFGRLAIEPIASSTGATKKAPFVVAGCQVSLVVSVFGGKANAAITIRRNKEKVTLARVLRTSRSRLCIAQLLESRMTLVTAELRWETGNAKIQAKADLGRRLRKEEQTDMRIEPAPPSRS